MSEVYRRSGQLLRARGLCLLVALVLAMGHAAAAPPPSADEVGSRLLGRPSVCAESNGKEAQGYKVPINSILKETGIECSMWALTSLVLGSLELSKASKDEPATPDALAPAAEPPPATTAS